MGALLALGSREAPIVLDDDEEDDEVICLGGPSKLPHNTIVTPIGRSLGKPIDLYSTPDTAEGTVDCVVIDDDDDGQGPPGPQPSPGEASGTPTSDQHQQASTHFLCQETGLSSTPNQDVRTGTGDKTLKRKWSQEDTGCQETSRPTTPLPNSIPPQDAVDSLAETRMAMSTKRLKAEQAGTSAPWRVSYKGPSWPSHMEKATAIPEAGFGPLEYGIQSVDIRCPAASKPLLSPNTFGPPDRTIGKYTSEPKRCMFPSDEHHDPTRTLILDLSPRRFRSLDFVLQWCRDVTLPDDPAPSCVLVIRQLGKALVEFTSPEQADRAFDSPRMTNRDGRTQITAVWYRTPDGVCHSFSKRQEKRTLNHEQSAFHTPMSEWASHASNVFPNPFEAGLPFRPDAFGPFVPFSQTVIPFPPTPVFPPFPALQQPPAPHIDQMASMPSFVTQDCPRFQECNLDAEMKDDEVEEQLKLPQSGSSAQTSHQDSISQLDVDNQQLHGQNSSSTRNQLELRNQDQTRLGGRSCALGPSSDPPHNRRREIISQACEGASPYQELPQIAHNGIKKVSIPWPAENSRRLPSSPTNQSASCDLVTTSVEVEKPLTTLQEYKAATMRPSSAGGSESQSKGTAGNDSPPEIAPELAEPTVPSRVTPVESSILREEGEITPSDMDVDQPDLSTVSSPLPRNETSANQKHDQAAKVRMVLRAAGDPEQKLAELRDRVLASRRRKVLEPAANTSSFIPTNSLIVADPSPKCMSPDKSSASSTSSASSYNESDTQPSSASIPASSSSGIADHRSSSYYDKMASSFLEDILGPLKSATQPVSDMELEVSPRISTRKSPAILLHEKQRRLEEHLARSKKLLSQWEVAQEKSEKARIMKLIKEEKSKFEAEQAAADAELRQLEVGKTTASSKSKTIPKRPPLRRWPQTQPDQLVIALSDNEDDGEMVMDC